MKRKQSGFKIMMKLITLVKPLRHFMALAVFLGVIGFFCAIQITVLGSMTLLTASGISGGVAIKTGCIFIIIFAILRGFLHYGEQACNHYIAFKLLALIRDKVFKSLRRLTPAKLEGKDKGNLISVITSDIELLEVFYAHTISPICIAILTSTVMLIFIGRYSLWLSLVAFVAYFTVGAIIPILSSKFSKNIGMTYRTNSGALSGYVLESMRGLLESIRYNATSSRLKEMNKKTDELNSLQKNLKRLEGKNISLTDTAIIFFSTAIFLVAVFLYNKGIVKFDGIVVSTVSMMSLSLIHI